MSDGTLGLKFRVENKAAVVSAIAVAAQEQAHCAAWRGVGDDEEQGREERR